jgi:hypothetical protein
LLTDVVDVGMLRKRADIPQSQISSPITCKVRAGANAAPLSSVIVSRISASGTNVLSNTVMRRRKLNQAWLMFG